MISFKYLAIPFFLVVYSFMMILITTRRWVFFVYCSTYLTDMKLKLPLLTTLFLIFSFAGLAQWDYTILQTPVVQLSTFTHGDSIYVIGGNNGNGSSEKVQIYDPVVGIWVGELTMNDGRIFAGSAVTNKAMYVVGGNQSWASPVVGLRTVEIFNFNSGTWSSHDLGKNITLSAGVVVGSKVIFTGGLEKYTFATNEVISSKYIFIYDEETDTWSKDSLSVPRSSMGVAHNDSLIFFAGGQETLSHPEKIIEIYNVNQATWTIDSLSVARSFPSAVYHEGKFYFAGGGTGGEGLASVVDIYDGSTWDTTHMVTARYGALGCAIDDKLYFVGGGNFDMGKFGYTSSTLQIDVYDIPTGEWSTLNMFFDRMNHRIEVHNNQLYIIGGASVGGGIIEDVEIYNPKAGTFTLDYGYRMNLVPNPAQNQVQIMGLEDLKGEATLQVLESTGKVLIDKKLSEMLVDISDLPSGLYFIKVSTEGGVGVKTLVKE